MTAFVSHLDRRGSIQARPVFFYGHFGANQDIVKCVQDEQKLFIDSRRAWQLADPFPESLLSRKHEHVVAPPRLQLTLPDDKRPALVEGGFVLFLGPRFFVSLFAELRLKERT